MTIKAAALVAASLTAACAQARDGDQPIAPPEAKAPAAPAPAPSAGTPPPAPAATVTPAPTPTAAQRAEALAFTDHPFVLGSWKIPEANRPLMRCVQIMSGTRTDVATGEVERISKIGNRCSFPVRFIGEVGKSDAARTVCIAELRVKTLMLPEGDYDLPDMQGGNCFGDVELVAAETGEN